MAAVSSTAFAQSTATLYGVADLGYQTSTDKDAAGNTTGKSNGMVSGVQSGSRWGIKGTEDLGGGMKASFNFESAIGANDGTGNSAFGRRSVVELSGGFGTVGLGRDYTPSFGLIGGTDVTGTDGSATSNLYPAGVRASNMFMYTSPNFNGIVVQVGLVAQKSGTPADAAKTNLTDVSLTYAVGPLMLGAAFGSGQENTAAIDAVAASPYSFGSAAVAASEAKTSHNVFAATYDLGTAKLFANMINSKNKSNNGKTAETNFGVSVPMDAITLLAGIGTDSSTTAGIKSKGTDFVLGADYKLSKSTNFYTRYSNNQTAVAFGKEPKTSMMHLGLRHKF